MDFVSTYSIITLTVHDYSVKYWTTVKIRKENEVSFPVQLTFDQWPGSLFLSSDSCVNQMTEWRKKELDFSAYAGLTWIHISRATTHQPVI